MVWHLEKIRLQGIPLADDPPLRRLFNITRKEKGRASVLEAENKGEVVRPGGPATPS